MEQKNKIPEGYEAIPVHPKDIKSFKFDMEEIEEPILEWRALYSAADGFAEYLADFKNRHGFGLPHTDVLISEKTFLKYLEKMKDSFLKYEVVVIDEGEFAGHYAYRDADEVKTELDAENLRRIEMDTKMYGPTTVSGIPDDVLWCVEWDDEEYEQKRNS